MSHLLLKGVILAIAVLWLGIMGCIAVASAYEVKKLWAAIPTATLFVLLGGLVIVAIWCVEI